jgi:hypothetical protein
VRAGLGVPQGRLRRAGLRGAVSYEVNTLTAARVVVDPDTLRVRPLGPATGDVHLILGDAAFPAVDWNDFVLPILAAFADGARALLDGARTARIHFMDAPYAVELSPDADAWAVRLSDGVHQGRPRKDARVDPAPLVVSVLAACDAVLRACAERHHADHEVQALAAATRALRAAWAN